MGGRWGVGWMGGCVDGVWFDQAAEGKQALRVHRVSLLPQARLFYPVLLWRNEPLGLSWGGIFGCGSKIG